MSEQADRNEKGQFEKGSSGNPVGRPSKAREQAYLAVLVEEVSLEDWRTIVRKAKDDATTSKDFRAREYGRRFIADYAIGKPKQTIAIRAGKTGDEFAELSDDELRAIIAADADVRAEPGRADDEEAAGRRAGAGGSGEAAGRTS